MREKKYTKISLFTLFIIIAIIVIGVMGYMMYKMNTEIKQLSEKVANSENVTANDIVVDNNNENKNVEDISDITTKCKAAIEEYYDLQVEFYSGGSLYVLKKLDLVSTTPDPEQYETTTYEFDDFYKTDIKYSDFKNAMLEHMTSELLEKEFEESHAKNVNGYLQITAMGGTATYIDIDKFELSSKDENSYTFDITAEKSYDDNSDKNTVNMKVTFVKQNGNYVVSNIENI